MPNAVQIFWDATPTDFGTLTNLNSLAAGNIWQSGEITDASPTADRVSISYELDFNATPIAGDLLVFRFAHGDEAASNEIWDGGIGTSESEISAAASIAAVKAALPPVWQHPWITSHGVEFKGSFIVPLRGPSWQLLIEAVGEALAATTNRVRYRYGYPQIQD